MMKKIVFMLSLILVMSSFVFAAGNDANTTLLLHMDGDESSSEHVATVNGDPVLDAGEYKFDGSMYFDGSGDYLTIPDSADWDFGSDDFTIDFWIKRVGDHDTYDTIIGKWDNVPVNTMGWIVEFDTNNKINFDYTTDGSNYKDLGEVLVSDNAISTSNFQHIAIVRDGTTLYLFVNGALNDNYTIGSDIIYDTINPVTIGAETWGRGCNIYLDEIRISNNARWTSDFSSSLPSSPYSADANTKLLLSLDGDVAEGASNDHDVTFHGDAQIDATNAPTGFEGSYKFDGSGDYLSIPDSDDWDFGTDEFTIDFWMKTTDTASVLFDQGTLNAGGVNVIQVWINSDGKLGIYLDGTVNGYNNWDQNNLKTDLAVNDGSWHHIALVKDSGNQVNLYVDGTAQTNDYPVTQANMNNGVDNLYIAQSTALYPSDAYDGYIDELRILKGTAEIPPSGGPTEPYSEEETNCTDADDDDYCLESSSSGCDNTICPTGWDDCDDTASIRWRNVDDLYQDNDEDGYTVGSPATRCVGMDWIHVGGINGGWIYYEGSKYTDQTAGEDDNDENPGIEGNGVPEFSSIGMVLALLIAGLGIVFVIKKKQ
ncbi:hypothetical protein GF336_06000 [Candidatus Woesearchaeota archaeon]|nr:hypothetical protein [Candidatus Woesearchaeota archaeon]